MSESTLATAAAGGDDGSTSFLEELEDLIADSAFKDKSGGEGSGKSTSETDKTSSELLAVLRGSLPEAVLGTLAMGALDAFSFLLDPEGRCHLLTGDPDSHIGPGAREAMEGSILYPFILSEDRPRIRDCLARASVDPIPVMTTPYERRHFTFTCRFHRHKRMPPQKDGCPPAMENRLSYEAMQLSCTPVRPDPAAYSGPLAAVTLSRCRLACVVRGISPIERTQYFPVDLFTTRLDPAAHFCVMAVDTSGMNVSQAGNIGKMMLGKTLVECAHPDDRAMVSKHLVDTAASPGKRLLTEEYLLGAFDREIPYVRVRTKSTLYAGNADMKSYLLSTHAVIGESDTVPDNPDKLVVSMQEAAEYGMIAPDGSYRPPPKDFVSSARLRKGPPMSPIETGLTSLSGQPVNNNNLVKNNSSGSSSSSSSTSASTSASLDSDQQKNQLLKQLLNVNFSRSSEEEEGPFETSSPSSSATSSQQQQQQQQQEQQQQSHGQSSDSNSSRILQLLSQNPDGSDKSALAAGVKRSASCDGDDGGPAVKSSPTSAVIKQNPSLTNLLSKPLQNSVTVPPPVPTKWHQEPREKLPKGHVVDGLKKFLPPHPAERGSAISTSSTTSTTSSHSILDKQLSRSSSIGTVLQPRQAMTGPPAINVSANSNSSLVLSTSTSSAQSQPSSSDLEPDAILSEILEGVIDIQEKSPTTGIQQQSNKLEIENIEKFLASSEGNGGHSGTGGNVFRQSSSSSGVLNVVTTYQRSSLVPSFGPVQSVSGSPSQPVASNVGGGVTRRISSSNPVARMPGMNELFQVVPPNVSVRQCPDLDSLVMLQQKRRSLSGSGSIPVPKDPLARPPLGNIRMLGANVQQQQPSQRPFQQQLQPSPTSNSSATNSSLLRQLNSAPLNQRQSSQQRMPIPVQQGFTYSANSSYQQQQPLRSGGVSLPQQQQPTVMTRYPSQQQVLQPGLQQQVSFPSSGGSALLQRLQQQPRPPQPPSTTDGGVNDGKSLLQQLLSE